MSVMRIRGRTTNSDTSFDSNAQSINSLIFLSPNHDEVEEFSIEIRLGDGWNENYSEKNKNLIKIEDGITVRPNGSIVVEVLEEIRVPHNRYGIVLPTGSLFLAKGVLITAAKVEPAFHGKLKVRLYNTTSEKVYIKKRDKLGSIIFMNTDTTRQLSRIHRASEISTQVLSRKERLYSWIRANKIQTISWIVTLISGSMMAAFIAFGLTFYFYYKPILDKTLGSQ